MRQLIAIRSLRSRRGLASALIIMILVLLIFFAVLSLVASAADLRLARKRANWNQQHYVADAGAVELYADLDRYCASLAPEMLEPVNLQATLDAWLGGRRDVREYELTGAAGYIQADLVTTGVLAGQAGESPQGVAMTLIIGAGRLEITRWAQWQMPFNYDSGNGGIWEG